MCKEISKRVISLLLCAAMLLGNFPVVGFAAEQDGLCEHHTDHVDCTYVEGASTCDYVCEVCPPATEDTTEPEETTEPVTEPEETTDPVTEPEETTEPVTEPEEATEPATEPEETEESKPVCTGRADCAAENHGDTCEKKIAEDKAAADKVAADAVSALIAELPTLEQLQAMPLEEQSACYNQVQSVYSAYEQLTDDQKALLPPAEEVFKPYFDYFNGQTEAMVAEGTCGAKLTWVLDDAGILTISGSGAMYNTASAAPWAEYCAQINSVIIADGVTSIGFRAFRYCSGLTSIEIPDSVTSISFEAFYECRGLRSVVIPDGVTSIGDLAFAHCTSLTSVTIPDSVTSVGDYAFTQCDNLTDVYIDDLAAWLNISFDNWYENPLSANSKSKNLYVDGELLTDAVIPDGVTWISSMAFRHCGNLRSVTIPEGVTRIGGSAFRECSSLVSVSIPDGVTSIGPSAFEDCSSLVSVSIPDGVTSIGQSAFEDCSSLVSVTIPEGVTNLEKYAFENCSSLLTLEIPSSVTSIGDYAFYRCSSLLSVEILPGVTSIGNYAFYGCQSLLSVEIPSSVISIGDSAFETYSDQRHVFYGGTQTQWYNISMGVRNVYLTDSTIHYEADESVLLQEENLTCAKRTLLYRCAICDEVLYDKILPGIHQFKNGVCTVCGVSNKVKYNIYNDEVTITGYAGTETELVIPSTIAGFPVTAIGSNAFSNYSTLRSVTIPSSVVTIGYSAFRNCSNLSEICIKNGVTTIGFGAFENCIALTDITLPASVTAIDGSAFLGCDSLTYVVIPSGVNRVGSSVFNHCSNLENIYFGGTVQAWNKLKQTLTDTDGIYDIDFVHCGYTTPEGHWSHVSGDVTCDMDGYTCERCLCGYDADKVVTQAWGHNVVTDPAIEATCIEPGKTEGSHCGICGEILVAQKVINPTGHYVLDAQKTEQVQVDSITDRNDENYYFGFGQFNGEYKYASTNRVDNSISIFTICAVHDCTLVLEYEVSSESNHDKLTVSQNGITKDTVSGEEAKIMTLILAAGDQVQISYGKDDRGSDGADRGYFRIVSCTETIINRQKRVPVTELETVCTDEIVCAGCNQIVKPATEHPYNSVVTPPTCTTDGYTTYTCSVCKYRCQDTIVPALGHNEVIISEIAPTCYEFGLTEGSHCSRCGKTVIEQSIIPYGHSYNEGRCTVCNQYSSMEGFCGDGVYWRLKDNGTSLYIYGKGAMYDYRGDAPWMAYKNKLTKVVVEDGVENVGDFAFYECSALNSVILSDSVKKIGEGAFQECLNLTRISLPKKLTTIGQLAFFSTGLRSLFIPHSVSYIGFGAFLGCDNLLQTIIGANPSLYIGTAAFAISGTQYQKPKVQFLGIFPPSVESCIFSATGTIAYYPASGWWREDDFERIGMYWTEWIAAGSSELIGCDSHRVSVGIAEVPSTCTRQGYSKMTYCSVCGTELDPRKTLPLAPHSEEIVIIEEPTCTETGLYNIICSVCNVVLEQNLVAASYGHDFSGMHHKCVRCDYYSGTCGENLTWLFDPSNGSLTISGTGALDDYSAGNAPWDTHRDTIRLIQIAAGVTAIAPDTFGDVTHEREIYYGGTAEEWNALAVNVSANDRVHYSCTEPEGHWQFATVEMTCEEDGYTAYRCDCGHEYGRTIVQPAGGHTIVTDAAVAPTCMQTGLMEGTHCAVCEKVIVAQEVLPATGHAYEKRNDQLVCNTCGQEVYVRIRQDYLAMDLISFREAYLDLQVSHEELRNEINWTVEGDSVALDAENLCLAAEKLGNAWITATVTVSNGLDKTDEHYEEFEVRSHCRVEVAESIQLKGIQLSTATVTTELFKSDYTGFEILLQLPDYYPEESASTYNLRRTSMMDRARLIRVDKEGNEVEDLSGFFELEIMDDRTVRIIPTRYALDHPTEVASKYSNLKVAVEVQGTEYKSENLTLTVKKTAPKVTGTVATFNSFYNGQTQQIVIKGATPVENGFSENEAKTAAIPYWLDLREDGTLQLSDSVPLKSISTQKAYITVQTEEWRDPVAVTLSVKNTFKAPDLKLSATSVTMSSLTDSSNGMVMKLLCTNKKDTLAGLNVKNITANDGFAVENFNIRDGSFVLRAPDGFKEAPKGTPVTLTVSFNNTTVTRDYKLTVKTAAVALKLGTTSITLNKKVSDSIKIKVTATPTDYRLDIREDQDIRLTATEKVNGKNTTVDKTESGELAFRFENGELLIQTTPNTPETATYKLYVKSGDSKEVTATVKVISGTASVSFSASGSMDLSFPKQTATLMPTFKNYKGEITGYTCTISELKSGKVVNEKFDVKFDGTAFNIRCIDDETDLSSTYKVALTLKLNDGSTIDNYKNLKVKRTAVKLKLSTSKLTLNKLIGDEGSIAVSCATKGYAFTKPIVKQVTDKYKQPAENQLNIRYADGRLYIATNEDTVYGMTYTVSLQANEKAAVQNVTVTIPTEAKSKVTVSLKASGKIDVIRDGSAVTVTPTYKNRLTATPAGEALYIYNAADRSKTCVNHLFDIQSDGKGGYSITKAEGVTLPTGTYKVRFEATFGTTKMDPEEVSMTVIMGSTKLTNQMMGSTLFSKDRNDMAFIQFEAADAMLNDVLKVEIKDTKYKDAFEIIDCGDGLFAIGYKGGKIHSAIANLILKKNATITLNLNVYMAGNPTVDTAKPTVNTTAKVKLTIVK